jgi:DNA-binding MarR family transcriptional regulator
LVEMAARSKNRQSPPPRPHVQTTYALKQVEMALRKEIDRVVRPFGLTTDQYTALSVLTRNPGISSAELARQAFVSPQAASIMVATLERKGVVSRRADPSNQRTLESQLTQEGIALLRECRDAVLEIEDRMLSDLDGDERSELRDLLRRCLTNLSTPNP